MALNDPDSSRRVIGRSDLRVPPVVWRLADRIPCADELALLHACGMDMLLLPEAFPDVLLPPLARTQLRWVIEISARSLRPRGGTGVADRLGTLDLHTCAAVCISDVSTIDLKNGWPMHRVQQLRDDGVTEVVLIECPTAEEAEWVVTNSSAHGVIAPYDDGDAALGERAILEAAEAGVGILAVRSLAAGDLRQSLRFRLADPRVACAIELLPAGKTELSDLLDVIVPG